VPHDTDQPTALYRLFDAAGRLLYVGIACDPEQRFKSHASTAPWWPLVERKEIEWRPNRSAAELDETHAIKAEGPLYNRAGSDAPMNVTLDFADLTDVSVAHFRNRIADIVHAAAVRKQVTYITSRGRRVAAIVPVPEAEEIEAQRSGA
jgi:prevent-host-death family protein